MAMHWAQTLIRGEFVSSIWSVPGTHPLMAKVDWMHAVCLGTLQYALGHSMKEAFRSLGGVVSNLVKANETCMKLLNMLKMVCPEGTEMPIGDLTVGMFQNDKGKAKMRLKAAEGRYLLPLVVLMFQNLFPTDTPHATLRLHCLHALNNCYKIIREWQTDGTSTADLRRET